MGCFAKKKKKIMGRLNTSKKLRGTQEIRCLTTRSLKTLRKSVPDL